MPYAPGISYRGDQWIAEGGQQMAGIAQMLLGYMLNQKQKKDELSATAEALAGQPAVGSNAPDGAGSGAPPYGSGGGPVGPPAPASMLEGTAGPSGDGADEVHPLVQRGQQAEALRKLIQSYQPGAKDLHTALKGMSVGQLEGMLKGYGLQQQAAEHGAQMEERQAIAGLRRQQAVDDQMIGVAVNRYAQAPEVPVAMGEDGKPTESRPPTAEERFRFALATPKLAGRAVPKLIEALSKYGEMGMGAKPPVVTKGPYPGVSFVQGADGKGGLHVVTDPSALTTEPVVDAQGNTVPGLYSRGKSLVRVPAPAKDPSVATFHDRTMLLNTKKEYLAERAKAFLPEDKAHWDAAIGEVDAALTASVPNAGGKTASGGQPAAGRGEGPKAPEAPKVGAVKGGYKFKGGDPAKKENWEKVK